MGRTPRPPVTALEFGAAELARVESKTMPRWLPVSGTMQPVNQATVKAKVSGDVRQITVREGDAVQAGQVLVRVDTADLDARVLERQGQLQSARAQLALAEKTNAMNQKLLKQNFISQNAFDNAESSLRRGQGQRAGRRRPRCASRRTRCRTPSPSRRCPASSPSATCSRARRSRSTRRWSRSST